MFRYYVVSVSFYCLASQEGQCVKLQTRLFKSHVITKLLSLLSISYTLIKSFQGLRNNVPSQTGFLINK